MWRQNQKAGGGNQPNKMCLSEGRIFMKDSWNIKKLVFLLIVYLAGFVGKSTTAPPSYNNPNNPTEGACETSK